MSTKRLLILIVLVFLSFLTLYTWNVRTKSLDTLSTNTGLELAGITLKSADATKSGVNSFWAHYVNLRNVREENDILKNQVENLKAQLSKAQEEQAELKRLRQLLNVEIPEQWSSSVATVIAHKLGAFSALETIVLNKGYLSGASVGKPLMEQSALLGRIYKASPSTSIALLVTDLGSRVAVVSGHSRVQGILTGSGGTKPLEVHFISQEAQLLPEEILYTSGLDGVYPKGIAVAQVTDSQPLLSKAFQVYFATPLANFHSLEEVLILTPPTPWQLEKLATENLYHEQNQNILSNTVTEVTP